MPACALPAAGHKRCQCGGGDAAAGKELVGPSVLPTPHAIVLEPGCDITQQLRLWQTCCIRPGPGRARRGQRAATVTLHVASETTLGGTRAICLKAAAINTRIRDLLEPQSGEMRLQSSAQLSPARVHPLTRRNGCASAHRGRARQLARAGKPRRGVQIAAAAVAAAGTRPHLPASLLASRIIVTHPLLQAHQNSGRHRSRTSSPQQRARGRKKRRRGRRHLAAGLQLRLPRPERGRSRSGICSCPSWWSSRCLPIASLP